MGIKGSSTRTLILDQVQVPKENLLGEPGKGHVIAFNILNIGRYKARCRDNRRFETGHRACPLHTPISASSLRHRFQSSA